MDDLKTVMPAILFIGVVLGAIIVLGVATLAINNDIVHCRKTHNVYKCEVQYVPVKGD